MKGIHKDTNEIYDPNSFNRNGLHEDANIKYDPNGFNIYGIHKYTNRKYDSNGFNIKGIHRDTNRKYDSNGFNIKGIHRNTDTFLTKNIISENINWLKNKNEFLKLYNEIIKKGEFTETANKKVISSKIFKKFAEDILNRNINNNNKKNMKKILAILKKI